MTNKERLESIKEDVEIGIKVWGISIDDIKWLVEQAEKKTELEHSYRRTISKQNKQNTALYKQNKRYLEIFEQLYNFDGNVQEHSKLTDMLCGEALEGEE
ncbi:hypothetical protein CAI16_05315 [Virgibacillus dokdonensis]|uniref:Uncharacterized protein n=1 Tax=Virgibacillus dokdonensis TaxID=302167 RepID=A0A3E0WVJ7_9BACI|nr:hypothetical protein [Virgibacillus dokdonensis]RFA36213.1 hypothetical protein CAI16_05315 [Virgibacillus dokdonensis]